MDLIFYRNILFIAEFTAAIVGLLYFFRLKGSYWQWFSIYLILIFLQELYWFLFPNLTLLGLKNFSYYKFIVIPFQYLFLFWLYALKSLKKTKLFYLFSLVFVTFYYCTSIFYFGKENLMNPINATMSTILLMVLIVMEYLKQIKNDDILLFGENKMFYVNIGVILYYVGTYPLKAFRENLWEFMNLGEIYLIFHMSSATIMYILFAISFIWGKRPLN